jgi:hypothetical protein
LRLWVVVSGLWIAGLAAYIGLQVADPGFRQEDSRLVAAVGAAGALGPPLLVLALGSSWFWVAGGFRRRPGDGEGVAAAAPPSAPRWWWSTPETETLYRHLTGRWHDLVVSLARDTAQAPGDGGLTWDRSVAAHRRFERALRAAVEDRCDAFFLDGVTSTDAGLVCRDVGSFWRIHWSELAGRLLAELGNLPAEKTSGPPTPDNDAAPERASATAT